MYHFVLETGNVLENNISLAVETIKYFSYIARPDLIHFGTGAHLKQYVWAQSSFSPVALGSFIGWAYFPRWSSPESLRCQLWSLSHSVIPPFHLLFGVQLMILVIDLLYVRIFSFLLLEQNVSNFHRFWLLLQQNQQLTREPSKEIEHLQEELIASKLREAEANLALKELQQKVHELEKHWQVSGYINKWVLR